MATARLKVVYRDSPLSLLQVREVFSFFPETECQLVPVQSYGDKNKHIPLTDAVTPDFFTRELDEALLHHEADVAVHSAKDLPYPLPRGLALMALLEATDQTDTLVSRNNLTLEQLPQGAKVGTSSLTRKTELLQRRPDLEVVSVRGNIGERIAQVDNGAIDALIVAGCALKRLGLESRIACILDFKTHPLQGHLAVVGCNDRKDLMTLFAPKDIRRSYGKVTLAGFGPGHPDLLTVGADKALAAADIIFHDDLIDPQFLSRYTAEKVYVGKRKDTHRFRQEEINELVYRAAIAGKNTVRLKGGDPMIFAHGREEIDFLQSRLIDVQVIPGISSGIAMAARTHIPLTHRGLASSVAFITGHAGANAPVPAADTLVYYMGGAHIADIARQLLASGKREDMPAALAYNVSLPDEQIFYSTLKELQHTVLHYPTPILMMVGPVVAFESHVQPVLLTGTCSDDYTGTDAVTHLPLIRIQPLKNNRRLYDAIRQMNAFDRIVFTSRYAVRFFFDAMKEQQADIRALANVKLAAVGQTTAATLAGYHVYPDLVPATASAEGLVNCFEEAGVKNQRILLPRSAKALPFLPDALQKMGNRVIDFPIYDNVVNDEASPIDLTQFRKIIFPSPSCVDAFEQFYGSIPNGIPLIAKGKTTEERLKRP
ncbi:MAG: uroporphyrinogen-III C-methyltransferase [Bacteroidales bacterium]|jgi:uroporphyrinogen III methyltransferase/synthase|nr:uroporphyrinogen-III C-methyltransferase [Bacteroidales bacterium]